MMNKKYFIMCVAKDSDFLLELKRDIDAIFGGIYQIFTFDLVEDALFIANNISMTGSELLLFAVTSDAIEEHKNIVSSTYMKYPATNYVLFGQNSDFEILKYFVNNVSVYRLFEKDYEKFEFKVALYESIKFYENNKIAKTYQQLIETTLENRMKELQELNARLNILANTDSLTNIRNRRSFFDIAENIMNYAKREKDIFGFVMFDIDDFKHINDNFGHQIGDEVLKIITQATMKLLRESDVVARYGGEEFVIVLQDTTKEGILNVCSKLLFAVTKAVCDELKTLPLVTVSIGATYLKPEDNTIDDLIKRADIALYKAKASGKNRVEFSD